MKSNIRKRSIITPCCKERITISFNRNNKYSTYTCYCDKRFKVYFDDNYKNNKVIKKEIM